MLIWIVVFGSFLSASAVGIETETHCDTLTFNGSSMQGNYSLPLFDPDQGNLVGVSVATDLGVEQNFSLENNQPESQELSIESESKLTISMPDSSSISVNASISESLELAAYDGEIDFAGLSGKTIAGVKSTGSAQKEYSDPSDFISSFQNQTVSLPATISVRSETSGNIAFSMSTIVQSKICVTYTYEPKGS